MKRATVTVDLVLNQAAMVKTIPHLLELIIQNMQISCPLPPQIQVLPMITVATKQIFKDRYIAMIMEEKINPIISRYEDVATIVNVS